MLNKRINEITLDDIERLVSEETPEGDTLEFKEALAGRDGPDPWHSGADRVTERARDDLMEPVIAFANTHGGAVVLGIRESEDRPRRAFEIAPVPRCADLAERVRLFCRDRIEPQLPTVEVAPIVTSGEEGVLIIRTPRSRLAPHRHRGNLQCYARHGDRTEAMTMREIQDLTLHIERGIAALEARFRDRAEAFAIWRARDEQNAFAFRATLLPLGPIYVDRVFGNREVIPEQRRFNATFPDGGKAELFLPTGAASWRPVLRGASLQYDSAHTDMWVRVLSDGTIDFWHAVNQEDRLKLYPNWWMGFVANALCAADHFRNGAGSPAVEYGLELEIFSSITNLPLSGYGNTVYSLGPFPEGSTVFPRYSLGDRSTLAQLAALIERDFWNAAGESWDDRIRVDFTPALNRQENGERPRRTTAS